MCRVCIVGQTSCSTCFNQSQNARLIGRYSHGDQLNFRDIDAGQSQSRRDHSGLCYLIRGYCLDSRCRKSWLCFRRGSRRELIHFLSRDDSLWHFALTREGGAPAIVDDLRLA